MKLKARFYLALSIRTILIVVYQFQYCKALCEFGP